MISFHLDVEPKNKGVKGIEFITETEMNNIVKKHFNIDEELVYLKITH